MYLVLFEEHHIFLSSHNKWPFTQNTFYMRCGALEQKNKIKGCEHSSQTHQYSPCLQTL